MKPSHVPLTALHVSAPASCRVTLSAAAPWHLYSFFSPWVNITIVSSQSSTCNCSWWPLLPLKCKELTRWLDVHQSAPTISAISLISLHCTSTISGNGSGGGGCGWRQRRRWPVWQRHTAQSALHGTSKDTKPNENKWPPMEAAPTLWARLVPLIARWLYLLSCEFLVS